VWVKLFVECRGFMWKIVKTGAVQLRRERRGYCNCGEGRLMYPRRMWCRVEAKPLGVVGFAAMQRFELCDWCGGGRCWGSCVALVARPPAPLAILSACCRAVSS
jgi:hypothetical protein